MKPQEAHDLIRAACLRRPELCFHDNYVDIAKERELSLPDYRGFCYIASQVFAYLTGAEVWADDDGMHYWNVIPEKPRRGNGRLVMTEVGTVWDLTKEQFDYKYPYHLGHKVPRKNKLTARARELLDECNNLS